MAIVGYEFVYSLHSALRASLAIYISYPTRARGIIVNIIIIIIIIIYYYYHRLFSKVCKKLLKRGNGTKQIS